MRDAEGALRRRYAFLKAEVDAGKMMRFIGGETLSLKCRSIIALREAQLEDLLVNCPDIAKPRVVPPAESSAARFLEREVPIPLIRKEDKAA